MCFESDFKLLLSCSFKAIVYKKNHKIRYVKQHSYLFVELKENGFVVEWLLLLCGDTATPIRRGERHSGFCRFSGKQARLSSEKLPDFRLGRELSSESKVRFIFFICNIDFEMNTVSSLFNSSLKVEGLFQKNKNLLFILISIFQT